MVAEYIASEAEKKGYKTACRRAEQSNPDDMLKFDVCVLASPTYGHGLLEGYMDKFIKKLNGVSLMGKPCAVIGLGDPKYEAQYHIESATILEDALTKAGGRILLPALRISRTPVMHLKGLVAHWAEQLIDRMGVCPLTP